MVSTRRGKKGVHHDSVQDQLDYAAASLEQNAIQMARLHGQWRTYLMMISYLVVLLSFHQFHALSSACLIDIKAVNRSALSDDLRIPGTKAIVLVLYDAAAIVLGTVMAAALCQWLRQLTWRQKGSDFKNPYYMVAHACVVPTLGIIYYQTKTVPRTTCLQGLDDGLNNVLVSGVELPSATDPPGSASWPLALVFHVIVTMSIWFMNRQQTLHRNNEKAVHDLLDELKVVTDAKKKK